MRRPQQCRDRLHGLSVGWHIITKAKAQHHMALTNPIPSPRLHVCPLCDVFTIRVISSTTYTCVLSPYHLCNTISTQLPCVCCAYQQNNLHDDFAWHACWLPSWVFRIRLAHIIWRGVDVVSATHTLALLTVPVHDLCRSCGSSPYMLHHQPPAHHCTHCVMFVLARTSASAAPDCSALDQYWAQHHLVVFSSSRGL